METTLIPARQVTANTPPANGAIVAHPVVGYALQTVFTISCSDWVGVDGVLLVYGISFLTSLGTWVALQHNNTSNTHTTVLPLGYNLTVACTVGDGVSASSATATISSMMDETEDNLGIIDDTVALINERSSYVDSITLIAICAETLNSLEIDETRGDLVARRRTLLELALNATTILTANQTTGLASSIVDTSAETLEVRVILA